MRVSTWSSRDRLQRRDVERRGELLQLAARRAWPTPKPRDIGVAGVEQDHAAGAQIAVELGIGLVRRAAAGSRRDRPVEEREERQLVGLQIDRHRVGRLDRGARGKASATGPRSPACATLVELRVAGDDMGQDDLARRRDRRAASGAVLRLRARMRRAAASASASSAATAPPRRAAGPRARARRGCRAPAAPARRPASRPSAASRAPRPAPRPGSRAGQAVGGKRRRPRRARSARGAGPRRHRGPAACRGRGAPRPAPRPARRAASPASSNLPKASSTSSAHPDGAGQLLGVGLRRAGRDRQPLQHLHEKPRQRQRRPFGVGGDVEQHDLPLRPSACAVTSGVPSASAAMVRSARSGSGCAITCALDAHIVGDWQPGEGRVLGEGAQRLRLAPAHRAADAAAAGAQAHRHQRVVLGRGSTSLARQARPGEAHQQPALLDPVQQPRPARPATRRPRRPARSRRGWPAGRPSARRRSGRPSAPAPVRR